MKEIFKYSSLIFLHSLAGVYIATCFAIDLKIQGYEERVIGFGLSFWGIGVIIGAIFHNIIRKKFNLITTIFLGSLIQLLFSLIIPIISIPSKLYALTFIGASTAIFTLSYCKNKKII